MSGTVPDKDMTMLAMFYQGFARAFGIHYELSDLWTCIVMESMAVYSLLIIAAGIVIAADKEGIDDLVEGLALAIAGGISFRLFFTIGLPYCKNVVGDQEVAPMIESVKFVENFEGNYPTMKQRLMEYGDELK